MNIKIASNPITDLSDQQTILAADVGATKTSMALFRSLGEQLTEIASAKYRTGDYPDIISMIRKFLPSEAGVQKVCLAVAGPVTNGKVCITNLPRQIDVAKLSRSLDGVPVWLLNDLEATAYGLPFLKENEIHPVYEVEGSPGNAAIIAPGTGLGEAGLYWDGKEHHPFSTEGGHCDFAPGEPVDVELYQWLQKKYDHISYERVVSGPGIANIFEFLVKVKERELPAWLAENILMHDQASVIAANAEHYPVCTETMQMFFRFLAHECRNLALKFKATGGVYIAGGVLPKNLPLFKKEVFLKHFFDAGRMRGLLKQVPVSIILNEKTPLLGAASFGRQVRHVQKMPWLFS